MNKIFYWSPFTSKVATVKAVINSVEAINNSYKYDNFKASIIDAVHEWKDFEDEIKEKKIELIYLNKKSIFNKFKKDGFLRSRFAYWYIFFKSFFPLIKTLKENKPKFLIIHLITSLPLFLFIFKKFDSKLILRISGLPKMTFLRKFLWKLAIKNVYKITCPTDDTFKDLSKFEFLKDKLCVLSDPILRIKEIQKMRKKEVKLSEPLSEIIKKKKFFLSIGRFTKQKNFFFYLNCIPEILKLDKDLFFLFIGQGEDKEKFIEISNRLNISDRILIINHTENVHYFMKKAYALVLPSLWEDPGFVLIEAGYNNCQVISSNCPNGPSEIIAEDGGYLFESNVEKSLIDTVHSFLQDTKNNKLSKKIILKKRLKKFTSFHHASKLKQNILNL
ncbi:glycosyltransferase [Pelagibacterales bacterium SAG-MED09]|nr:glycosyltransferase [Pelagibacterales bacterium SAG-MED09]